MVRTWRVPAGSCLTCAHGLHVSRPRAPATCPGHVAQSGCVSWAEPDSVTLTGWRTRGCRGVATMELGTALCTWRGVRTSNATLGGRVRSVSMLDYSTKHSGISAHMVVFQQGRDVEFFFLFRVGCWHFSALVVCVRSRDARICEVAQ